MSLDHIGAILFPDCLFLRLLGRISLPIFVFLLIEGYFHTSSKGKYFLRMLVFAFISEPFYDFAFYDTFFYSKNQNILFLLALGILFVFLLEQVSTYFKKKPSLDSYLYLALSHFIIVLFTGAIASILQIDYSFYGILMIYFMYLFRNHLLFYLLSFIPFVFLLTANPYLQLFHFLAIIILSLYNGKKGKSLKYFFYFYYPLHLIILDFIYQTLF